MTLKKQIDSQLKKVLHTKQNFQIVRKAIGTDMLKSTEYATKVLQKPGSEWPLKNYEFQYSRNKNISVCHKLSVIGKIYQIFLRRPNKQNASW